MSWSDDFVPRINPRVFDVALTTVLVTLGIIWLFTYSDESGVIYLPGDARGVLLVFIVTLPLLLRRNAPVAAGLMISLAVVLFTVWEYACPTIGPIMLIAIYSAAAYTTILRSLLVLAAFLAAAAVYIMVTLGGNSGPDSLTSTDLVFTFFGFVGFWGIGRAVRVRRLYTHELEHRALRLEQTREAEVRDALADERSRIARELHDVVAHHVSVMTVQAAGARRLVDRDPGRSVEALRAIEVTGRSALTEMRRMVGVLRGPDGELPAEPADMLPQPSLSDITALAEQLSLTGHPVQVTVEGEQAELPIGVELSGFRIVQEALTNTIKHAGPSRATVNIRYRPTEVVIAVTDDGRGLTAPLDRAAPGHGLLGMRERVALYGGTLSVGPRSGGGFEVVAHIPYDRAAV